MTEHSKGLFYGFLCYLIWGLFPLYWRLIDHVDSFEILAHRIAWSALFMSLFFYGLKRWRMRQFIHSWRQCLMLLVTGVLITFNWGLYIWAINHGYILQSSLGYYINPLVNVLFGFLFLKERLDRSETIALLLALAGVVYLTWQFGEFPFISIGLALSFATYGLIKKKMNLNATPALTMETLWLMPAAVAFIVVSYIGGDSALNTFHLPTWTLLLLAGPVTAIPLLLYGKAAERITLTALGFLQYISPTGQFLIGVFVYKEPFSIPHLVCFAFIWTGLIILTISKLRKMRAGN